MLERVHKVSRNTRYMYTQFNYLHTTYLTPHRLKVMLQVNTMHCPRCGTIDAGFLYMVWECLTIEEFWTKMVTEVERTLVRWVL